MPGAPTIGTATDGGNGTSVNVAFTAPSWVGKGTGTVTYTATSSPGGFTGTATSSPVTVSGLTAGTAYTFTVRATTSYGVTGPSSAASNSVTPQVPGSFESIVTTTLGSQQNSISFQNIPQTFAHLEIHFYARSVTNVRADDMWMWMNNDTTNAYGAVRQYASGTAFTSAYNSGSGGAAVLAKSIIGNSVNSNYFGMGIIRIPNYKFSGGWKPFTWTHMSYAGTSAGDAESASGAGVFQSNAAITRIDFGPPGSGFPANTQIALYGIKES